MSNFLGPLIQYKLSVLFHTSPSVYTRYLYFSLNSQSTQLSPAVPLLDLASAALRLRASAYSLLPDFRPPSAPRCLRLPQSSDTSDLAISFLKDETVSMFYLSEIEHTLRLPPHLLNLPLNEAIKGELEGLFLDKVIANLGLCISVYDIKSIDGGFIFPSDGASTCTVKFRLIVFRPFAGEVIAAKLKESNATGLRLSLGFFDDIYVPVHLMPNPSCSEPDPGNKNQVSWIWEFNDENYPIDGTDEIRFRVHSVSYPSIPVEPEKKESKHGKCPFAT